MKDYERRAIAMMQAARLLRAVEELAYAAYRDLGVPKRKAREIAHAIHGGEAGMFLLKLNFGEGHHA
jgi:methionine aminopeptidase